MLIFYVKLFILQFDECCSDSLNLEFCIQLKHIETLFVNIFENYNRYIDFANANWKKLKNLVDTSIKLVLNCVSIEDIGWYQFWPKYDWFTKNKWRRLNKIAQLFMKRTINRKPESNHVYRDCHENKTLSIRR